MKNLNIGYFSSKKKSKYYDKLKKINTFQINKIEKFKYIDEYDVIILPYSAFIRGYKYIKKSYIKKNQKFIVILSKNKKNNFEEKHYTDNTVYRFLPNNFSLIKLDSILTKILEKYRSSFEREELEKKIEIQNLKFNALTKIGISLSEMRDIDTLFDLILTKSREITNSDAGSFYLTIDEIKKDTDGNEFKEKMLKFVHSQNHSFNIKSPTFTIPLTKTSIVGYTALTGNILNIPDAHRIPNDADYSYSVETEKKMKVHNRSIIVVPMKNNSDEIIGVIQLFNKKKDFKSKINDPIVFEQEVIPYDNTDEEIVASLASQAAVSLENSILYKEIKTIFEGFIRASVMAIESRDPTTSGHSERVAKLTVELAKMVDKKTTGIYKDVKFNSNDIKNIEYAGLLHDFGKIGVREKVLIKAEKLYPEELENIILRYKYIKKSIQFDFSNKKIDIIKERGIDYYNSVELSLQIETQNKINEIEKILKIIIKANQPSLLEEDSGKVLSELADKEYVSTDGEVIKYLNKFEKESLTILRGSLTEAERKEIESHVTHTYKFLCNIPWTKDMSIIPNIAYMHHEKLDGKGYPQGVKASDIPIQARMMVISDIYDALTASDRPYKKAVSIDKALEILKIEKDSGKIDEELYEIFVETKIFNILN